MHTNGTPGKRGRVTPRKNAYKCLQGSGIHIQMHTKHTNDPQGSGITYKNTIEMEHGTFREAGLYVKTP